MIQFFLKLLPCLLFSQVLIGQVDSSGNYPPFFRGCQELPSSAPEKKACSEEALIRFISNGLQYPKEAIDQNVQGTVVVSFDITENGQVEDPRVEHNIGAGCGEAALKIIKAMPKWEAAQKDGKTIQTRMTLPVRFAFDEKSEQAADAYSLVWGTMRGGKLSKKDIENNLLKPVIVRDPYGNAVQISDFQMTLERGKRSYSTHTTGNNLTKKMKKLVKKAARGGTLSISIAVQKGTTFVLVEENLKITK